MPIIDPMYLYLIEVLHNIDMINQLVFAVLTIVLTMLLYVAVWLDTLEEKTAVKWWLKVISVAWLASFAICVLVPTKDMMFKMLLAHYVTTDNIQIVNDAIKNNVQDYLNMLVETVKNIK